MVLVSVVIPAYNSEKYIAKAINSVLSQTMSEFELIIVDDGSTDNTEKKIRAFNDKRIKYFYQPNAGPSAARNFGIKQSRGEFIAFLDADDAFMPRKLEFQLKSFKKDTGMVYHSFYLQYEGKAAKSLVKFKHNDDYIKQLLTDPFNSIAYPSTVMVRKEFMERAGMFNSERKIAEDWDMWLRMAAICGTEYINMPLTERFIPKTSITRTIDFNVEKDNQVRVVSEFIETHCRYEKYKNKALSTILCNYSKRHFYKNNKVPDENAVQSLKDALSLNPSSLLEYSVLKYTSNVLLREAMFRMKPAE